MTIVACGLRRRPALSADRCERSIRRREGHLEQRVPADPERRLRSALLRLSEPVCSSRQGAAGNRQHRSRPLRGLQPGRPHRSRAAAGGSRFQKDRPVLAVRALPGSRATECARNRTHPFPLLGSETWRRQLGLEPRQPPRPPPERVDPEHRDRRADLRPGSLFGLQSEDRAVRLQISR